jgi:cell wall-associated NlpC family hydrolase
MKKGHGMILLYRRTINNILLFFTLLSLGCASSGKHETVRPESVAARLTALGYSVQVGAFSDRSKAEKLADTLQATGIDAYFFSDGKGLFRVRFGEFNSGEEAQEKARELYRKGTIQDYFIIRPGDYPAAKTGDGDSSFLRDSLVSTAEGFIGIPYQWSGSSSYQGFDCSGLTMTVYKINGLGLPRTTRKQWHTGSPVTKADILKGDLVFFSIPGTVKTSHVGIYIGEDRFIHSPGKGKTVQIDSLSNPYFERYYLGARSYLQ